VHKISTFNFVYKSEDGVNCFLPLGKSNQNRLQGLLAGMAILELFQDHGRQVASSAGGDNFFW